jgi:hypothetical protein
MTKFMHVNGDEHGQYGVDDARHGLVADSGEEQRHRADQGQKWMHDVGVLPPTKLFLRPSITPVNLPGVSLIGEYQRGDKRHFASGYLLLYNMTIGLGISPLKSPDQNPIHGGVRAVI